MTGTGITKKIELVANIVIVACGLFFAVRFFFPHLLSFSNSGDTETIATGSKLGIHPAGGFSHDLNLVVAIRQGCHFCAESAPFYQRLAGLAKDSQKVHLLAVLPQDVAQGRDYLKKLGVPLAEIQQADLPAMKVRYTPTLILVDRAGAVRKVWVGKLSARREVEVLQELGLSNGN
jgi:hypothetical protein